MRWNCPHCGTNLAVADEKLGNGWSFSRCYKCGGFALARRSDVNLIKVDRVPEGEPVLLPEAHENPTTMLSQIATDHLARYVDAKHSIQVERAAQTQAAKPIIRTVQRGKKHSTQHPQPTAPLGLPMYTTPAGPTSRASVPPLFPHASASSAANTGAQASPFGLPEPLPEEPKSSIRQKLLPVAIGMTGMLAIASGIYLYIQGQAIWEKAQTQAREHHEPLIPRQEISSNEVIAAPTLARVSSANPAAAPVSVPHAELIDEVHARAMAPTRAVPAAAPVALAPQMRIEVLIDNAHIHSGPGMKFPIIGTVRSQKNFAVEEWKDRWFKISLEKNPGKKDSATTAWIRNDLVRPLPQSSSR